MTGAVTVVIVINYQFSSNCNCNCSLSRKVVIIVSAVQSAKKLLGVPETSAPIERVFSHRLYVYIVAMF